MRNTYDMVKYVAVDLRELNQMAKIQAKSWDVRLAFLSPDPRLSLNLSTSDDMIWYQGCGIMYVFIRNVSATPVFLSPGADP